eukprot:scaffold18177_cov77-Attheya_sp.AAC.2
MTLQMRPPMRQMHTQAGQTSPQTDSADSIKTSSLVYDSEQSRVWLLWQSGGLPFWAVWFRSVLVHEIYIARELSVTIFPFF